jgi:hypothetical protein
MKTEEQKNKTLLGFILNSGKVFALYLAVTILFIFVFFSQLSDLVANSNLWAVSLLALVWLGFGIGSSKLFVKAYKNRNK